MNAAPAFSFADIDRLTGGQVGIYDLPCPLCGPFKSARGQKRTTLRIWRTEDRFAGFHCARCDERGYALDIPSRRPVDRKVAGRIKIEADQRQRTAAADRVRTARWMWSQRQPIAVTPAECYLHARGCTGAIPPTLGFLPPLKPEHRPAMIAAYAIVGEAEPGVLAEPDNVEAVHLTLLRPDGSGKADVEHPKITIASPNGRPITLAPPNDLLGLCISEGIEDGLTAHLVTGLGAWAAGSATCMPALAAAVPSYIDCVTVYAHDDDSGRRHSLALADKLRARGFETFIEGLP